MTMMMIQADQRTLGYADIVCNDLAFGDEHEVDVLIEAVAEGFVVGLTFGDDKISCVVDLLNVGAGMFDHRALGDVTVANDGCKFVHTNFVSVLFGGVVDHGGTANTKVDA